MYTQPRHPPWKDGGILASSCLLIEIKHTGQHTDNTSKNKIHQLMTTSINAGPKRFGSV